MASREWSMGPNEPYWRTNTSFSPPLSRSWDHRFQSEGPPYSSGAQLYGSSVSTSSNESRSWIGGDYVSNLQNYGSDGIGSDFSSTSDSFQTQQWTPPPMQRVNVEDCVSSITREPLSALLPFAPSVEGTSAISYNAGSTSSRSDGSEYESVLKPLVSSHRNHSNRCSFMSKPIHPLSFANYAPEREARETETTRNSFDRPSPNENHGTLSENIKCILCGRFLLQRSPWSSRRIVRSGDMPIAGVLSCRHIFHAECLDQITPKTHKHDPPCPICTRSKVNASERNGVPRLKPSGEGFGQMDDCAEGTLHSSVNNTILSLNRSRLKKHLSSKGNSSKNYPLKLKKIEDYSLQSRQVPD